MGGRIVTSSLTGPDGENLGQLQPVEGQQDLRGADNYSISLVIEGGDHGDVFTCVASTANTSGRVDTTLSGELSTNTCLELHLYIVCMYVILLPST